MPCDPGQELVKVAFWLMGRDGAPRFHVGVVFTFLRGKVVGHDAQGQRPQAASVFFDVWEMVSSSLLRYSSTMLLSSKSVTLFPPCYST